MCCSELIKRKISQCFNREATEWIEKNYQDVSIDKIYMIQFSTRLAFLAHCNPVIKEIFDSAKNDGKVNWNSIPQYFKGPESRQNEFDQLMNRIEVFDFEVLRDEETSSDALLIYAKEKSVDGDQDRDL
ncbi:Oidioi.mRNA.OKI2018_I69.chr1.g1411.t1.cds [Oikopleura dioica]|uniref:Oidioi.mRNA.OKI2018_I69.chr1.g1411.t1.cds n=1 Tax=Oikopleura dioica TaxID=34765 RepID=A0ABN7SS21_OIKDI|nr:Oidioi.mRNA.OKI2018_I69.chr1.g1411.t1.cds [Oikopleura dioica]